jgi:hypothetical protein
MVNDAKKEGGALTDDNIQPADLAGIYKDIVEAIGLEATMLLHRDFQGQQVTFPKKLYSKSYILHQLQKEEQPLNIRAIALKFGYTERRLRQIIREKESTHLQEED